MPEYNCSGNGVCAQMLGSVLFTSFTFIVLTVF